MIAPEFEIISRRLTCRRGAPVVTELVAQGAEEYAEEGKLARFAQAPRWPEGP